MLTNAQIEDAIVRARVRMLMHLPFFGTMATRLIIKDGSGWIPTAATDGRHLYYNREFFSKLDKKELEFVIAHEVMHCIYDHMSRRGSRDPRLWNCAGDYVINYELMEQKVGKFPSFIQVLYEKKYENMSSEEIYEQLKQDQDDGKGDDQADSFDTHLDPDAGPGGNQEGDGEGQEGDPSGLNGPIPMDEEERAILRDEIRQATMQAAEAAGAGNSPMGVRRLLKDLNEPQMDWREILNMQIQSCFKSDFTFSRPNRKTMSSGIILPGMLNDQKMEVCIALDTSGSMTESMLRDLLSEIKGIMDQFTDFSLKLWTFDTAAYNMQEYTPDNMDEFLDYDCQGGGGTDFMAIWDFMKEEEIEPDKLIVFTDGFPFGSWGDPDYTDTVFVIHGSTDIQAPFGMTTFYTFSEGVR